MSQFLIGRVEEIISSEQIIIASVGTEFKVKAYPLRSIQQVEKDDQVLLIKVSEDFDTYMYLLLRLNAEFAYTYNQMVLGFSDQNTIKIKAPNVVIDGSLTVLGDVRFDKGVVSFNNLPVKMIGKTPDETQTYIKVENSQKESYLIKTTPDEKIE